MIKMNIFHPDKNFNSLNLQQRMNERNLSVYSYEHLDVIAEHINNCPFKIG